MTKQEFLAMSLPYGLKMCYTYENRIDIQTLLPMHFDCKCQLVNERGKPVLCPLSDLTKEIEHKGEKFVPIVVLAKMAWEEPLIKKFKIDREVLRYNFDGDEYYFEYRKNGRFLFARMTPYETFMPINNQFLLFQKLIEWHFDIADLISKGEAIDVNTLEINPYK